MSRKEWGELPSNLTEMKLPVHHVFIHHTAEEECFNMSDCKRLVKEMQVFHNVTRHFGDIGYNFIIGGDDNVYVGIILILFNSDSVLIAICFTNRSWLGQEWSTHFRNE